MKKIQTKRNKTKSTCKKQTTKKYIGRKSPPYSAMTCQGEKMRGNDGKLYVSQPDKHNVYKWVLDVSGNLKKPKRQFETHDNGSRPFLVFDYGNKVTVIPQRDGYSGKGRDFSYKKLFVGDSSGPWPGNTILLEKSKGKYVFIGQHVKEFSTQNRETILQYNSIVGNSDVPYPYAIGEHNTYFLLDDVSVPNEFLDMSPGEDLYWQFYQNWQSNGKATKVSTKYIDL